MSEATLTKTMAVLGIAATFAVSALATAAEVELKVQSALPKQHDLTKSFLVNFVDKINEAGKGVIQVKYIGGPEVTPAAKAAPALQRGVFDMLHSPAAYHVGIVPHGLAMMATNRTPAEIRANGGFDLLAPVWEKKLNAKIIAWGESGAQFHLYTVNKPKVDGDGMVDLTGVKIRTTGAYRPLLTALGATNVSISAPETFTGLQRGVVEGFGWPTVGLDALGLAKAVKYRIDPPFYHLANLVLVNLDKWNSLSPQAQSVLLKVGAEYEQESIRYIQDAGTADAKAVAASGVEVFEQTGTAGKKYLRTAYKAMWDRLGEKLSPEEIAALRAKMYKEE
jgi:TRAP-type C4-dicarboxylate transport system substrate-binding protein